MATICAVHDLSGLGRCSLTAAISVLSAMGHHCCPLPTAVLSQQTGFPGYSYCDFTPHMKEYIAGWDVLEFTPDIIFSGFLGNTKQPRILANYMKRHPGAIAVVDPVMGDNGSLYPCFDQAYVEETRQLVQVAHTITPNATEFLLLAGESLDPATLLDDNAVLQLADRLKAPGLQQVIITGIPCGELACNLLADLAAQTVERVHTTHTGVSYSGTGDLFASIYCGCIAHGMAPLDAVKTGAEFLHTVAAEMPAGSDPRFGLHFERYLHLLTPHHINI